MASVKRAVDVVSDAYRARRPVRTASGQILTRKDEERMADEAEAGLDLDEWMPVYLGRPSLSGNPGTSNRINLRVDDATYVQVHALAAQQKRPVSEVVRDAIKDYLAAS